MVSVEGNYYTLTDVQNKMIRSIKAKHTVVQAYLLEVLDYMRTQGVDITLNRIPSEFNPDGIRGAGWYGPIDGSIKNMIDPEKVLYSGAIWNESKGNEPILNIISSTGGGGSNFNYCGRSFISIDTLPLLKNIPYDAEKADVETNELNAIIAPQFSAYYRRVSDRSDEYYKSDEMIKLKKLIDSCKEYEKKVYGLYWILSKAKRLEHDARSFYNAEAEREFYYELPPITTEYVNTKEYYWRKHELTLNLDRFLDKPDFNEIFNDYQNILDEKSEMFV